MKRITKIEIDNYKAYATKEVFELPKGQNLLLYGENGSGKSSLFRALQHFMKSSVNVANRFDNNYYSGRNDGKIEVTFCDYDYVTNSINENTTQIFTATEDPETTTTRNTLLKTAYRISGFLDYSTLLKVYLNNGARPNLFDLVIELLSDYIPTRQGLTNTIGSIVNSVNQEIVKCYHRTDKGYSSLKNSYLSLQTAFPDIISDLNAEFSRLMTTYFVGFDLDISLGGTNINLFEGGCIRDTHIIGEIYLDVTHYGQCMHEYNNSLNEARLSAIAICLYLASLKLRDVNHDVKILYLDDVFVGLDSSNRRPVINILLSEFQNCQILISTYDKSWYLLAREMINDVTRWEYKELYEGKMDIAGVTLPKPIVVSGNSEIEMARKYLYDSLRPDYPAAANYMRKAYESLLSNKLYRPAILDDDLLPIAAYHIAALICRAENFLKRIANDSYAGNILAKLTVLKTHLRPMLHPLSHYAPDEPVYKSELMQAEQLFSEISTLLEAADYKNRCKMVVPKHGKLLLQIRGRSGWNYNYKFDVEDHLISYTDAAGAKLITDVPLQVVEMIEGKPDGTTKSYFCSKNSRIYKIMHYISIDDCVTKIVSFLSTPDGGNKYDAIVLPNHSNMFFCINVTAPPNPIITFDKVLTNEL